MARTTLERYSRRNQVRIEKAKRLLLKTSHPIVNIGAEIGFNNRQHFCKVFSAFTGMSPSEYRKQQKESEYTMLFDQKVQTFFEELEDPTEDI